MSAHSDPTPGCPDHFTTPQSGCSPRTVKPSRKYVRILCHAFIRKIYGPLLSTGLEDKVL
jgi:hypothetical protein